MVHKHTKSAASRVINILQRWAHDLVAHDGQFDGVYVFGSLVYKEGQQFLPESSDVDLVVRLAEEIAAPAQRVHACQYLLQKKRELEQKLVRVIANSDGKSRISTVVVSHFELEQGIHKDNAPFFFTDSDFLDLLDLSKEASSLALRENDIAFQPIYLYALPAIRIAQRLRNKFLAVGPLTACALETWDGQDVFPKDLMRASAQLRYFAEQLRDKSAFDVNAGLEYLHSLVQSWGTKGGEYAELAEWLTVRRRGRGSAGGLRPEAYLLVCEILAVDASKRLNQRLARTRSKQLVATHPTLTDEAAFQVCAEGTPSLKLGRLDLASKLFPSQLWDAERRENLFIDHPELNGVDLIWVPSELPSDLLSQLIGELETSLSKLSMSRTVIASQSHQQLQEIYLRLTEEGSNAYPRLAGNPRVARDARHSTLQVPIGPSKYGVALIREKKVKVPTAKKLSAQHILNSLAVRVVYIYCDTAGRKWAEFQQRRERENATYSAAWDVSAAGYIDPQRHEDPRVPGRISPWQACAFELEEELGIPAAELPHRDNYYFLGVGRNDPTGQLDLLAYCLGTHLLDPGRPLSPLVKGYDRCVLEPEALAHFVLAKRRWVPTALLTLILALEALGYSRRGIQSAFQICAGALDFSP